MSNVQLDFSPTLYQAAHELAQRAQMSLEQFITFAVTEQIAQFKQTDYLATRAQQGRKDKFKQAMSKIRQTPAPFLSESGTVIDLYYLGQSYQKWGEVAKAIHYYEQALNIARNADNRHGEALCAWHLGLLYEESDPARAVALMSVLVAYEEEIGHPDAVGHAAQVAGVRARAGRTTAD